MGEIDMAVLCSPMALPSQDYVPTMGPQPDDNDNNHPPGGSSHEQAPLDPQRIPVIAGIPDPTKTNSKTNGNRGLFAPPPRCRSCSAYVNPYWIIDTNTCNFCGTKNTHTDFDTLCLQRGTVDFTVDGPYVTRSSPVQPIFLYALDLTCSHVVDYVEMLEQVGIDFAHHFQRQPAHQQLQQRWQAQENSSGSSRNNTGSDEAATLPLLQQQRPRIGICFVASSGIVVLSPNGPQGVLQSFVMGDVTEEPFCHVPLNQWTFDLSTPDALDEWTRHVQQDLLEGDLLADLKKQAAKKNVQGLDGYELSCAGAALTFCADALAESGGRATWISTRRPNHGVGYIRPRGVGKASNQPSIEDATPLQFLQKPANKQDEVAGEFYRKLQEKCAKNRVVLDIIIHSNPEHVAYQSLDLVSRHWNIPGASSMVRWCIINDLTLSIPPHFHRVTGNAGRSL